MGKLAGSRMYLAGAMDRAADAGDGWRDRIIPELRAMGILVVDPRHKPIDMGMEDADRRAIRRKNIEEGNWEAVEADKDIRQIDLRCVDVCDSTIVYLDMNQHPFGTIEELVLANRQKKPIPVFVAGGKKNAPHWLFWMIGHEYIFDDMEQVLDYLRKVDSGEIVDKRWVLFDWDCVVRETEKVYGPL